MEESVTMMGIRIHHVNKTHLKSVKLDLVEDSILKFLVNYF